MIFCLVTAFSKKILKFIKKQLCSRNLIIILHLFDPGLPLYRGSRRKV